MSEQRPGDAAPTDPRVRAVWRAASVEEPPAGIDQAILAAARAAVQDSASVRRAPARDLWWRRWQPLAAAAAVTGLAFVLLQSLPRDATVRAPSVTPAPAGPAAREMAAPVAPPAARNEERPPAPVRSPEADAAPPRQSPTVAASPAAPEPVAEDRKDSVRRELEVSGVAGQAAKATDATAVTAERPAAPAAASGALAKLQGLARPRAPEDWVARIAERHAGGDLEAAADELRAFRVAYPDADSRLPESLRAWAATVTPPEAP